MGTEASTKIIGLAFSLIFLLLAVWIYHRLDGPRDAGVFSTNPPTPYRHYIPSQPVHGRILVVHGLDASKEVMNIVSLALADSGFEVYAIDLPGHGDSSARFDGLHAKDVVEQVLDQLGPGIAVLGHSFGGGVLLELASERDFDAMVLFSPGPRLVDHIRANRVLVVRGQFDILRVSEFVTVLSKANADILSSWKIPWTGHTGYMFSPSVQREVVQWLGGNPSGGVHALVRRR